MTFLDWSQCPAVESVPGRVGGAWVFRDTRMPVAIVFQNLEVGATTEEPRTTDSLRPGRMGEFLARWCRACAACALFTKSWRGLI
jgi:Protein of unknown function (DUF433)